MILKWPVNMLEQVLKLDHWRMKTIFKISFKKCPVGLFVFVDNGVSPPKNTRFAVSDGQSLFHTTIQRSHPTPSDGLICCRNFSGYGHWCASWYNVCINPITVGSPQRRRSPSILTVWVKTCFIIILLYILDNKSKLKKK